MALRKSKPPDKKPNGQPAANGGAERATHKKFANLADESRRWRAITIAVMAALSVLLLGGIIMLATSPPKRQPAVPLTPPAPARAGADTGETGAAPATVGVPVGSPEAAAVAATTPPAMPTPEEAANTANAQTESNRPAEPAEPARAAVATQLTNGDFEAGNLQGWTPAGVGGGVVQVVQAGYRFHGAQGEDGAATDTDQIPFQDGQWAVCLRSSGGGMGANAAAMITSEPVHVVRGALRWDQMAESEAAVTELRVMDADSGEVLLSQQFPRTRPRTTRNDVYWDRVQLDLNPVAGRTVRLQIRQVTEGDHSGWFTLVDNVILQ